MPHPRDDLLAEIAELRSRVDGLEAELAYERELNAVPDDEFLAAMAIDVPRWAVPALHLFTVRQTVTKQALTALAEDMDWLSAEKFPSFAVHRLRKHLGPKGIHIETEWGVGYRISPDNQARLKALIHQGEPP